MVPDYLAEHLQRYSTEYFIYPWNLFELRLQEEMIRSDRSESPFYFVEFPFLALSEAWGQPNHAQSFFELLLSTITNNARGSDIKGYLENERGIGLVLLDSGPEGWQKIIVRLRLLIEKQAPHLMAALPLWESKLVYVRYPLHPEAGS
jgi:hypothetical protein